MGRKGFVSLRRLSSYPVSFRDTYGVQPLPRIFSGGIPFYNEIKGRLFSSPEKRREAGLQWDERSGFTMRWETFLPRKDSLFPEEPFRGTRFSPFSLFPKRSTRIIFLGKAISGKTISGKAISGVQHFAGVVLFKHFMISFSCCCCSFFLKKKTFRIFSYLFVPFRTFSYLFGMLNVFFRIPKRYEMRNLFFLLLLVGMLHLCCCCPFFLTRFFKKRKISAQKKKQQIVKNHKKSGQNYWSA